MRRLLLPAALLAALVLAPAAHADHLTAAATVDIADVGPAERGARDAKVSWTATCSDGARPEGAVRVLVKPKNPGLAPRPVGEGDGLTIDGEDAVAGSQDFTIEPGRTWFAEIEVTCTLLADDGTDHEARATARSPGEVAVPPRLAGVSVYYGSWCDAPRAQRRGQLQALQSYRLEVFPVFDPFSMLRGRGRASYDEVIVHARGAGLRQSRRVIVNRAGLFTEVRPRRPGKLRIRVEAGGVETNERTLTVVPIRGGCRRGALATAL